MYIAGNAQRIIFNIHLDILIYKMQHKLILCTVLFTFEWILSCYFPHTFHFLSYSYLNLFVYLDINSFINVLSWQNNTDINNNKII